MTVRIETKIEGRAAEFLARLQAQLGEAGRKKLEAAAAKPVAALVQRHLFALGQERHATAKGLGATPSNVIGRTAEGVAVRRKEGGTFVAIPHPLFRRAVRDVEIAPRTAKALAIPVAAAAYDKAPRSFAELFVWRKDRTKDDKGAAFLARTKGKGKNQKLELLFLLHRGRILQKRDPSLLPTGEDMAKAGRSGLRELVRRILARKGGAA